MCVTTPKIPGAKTAAVPQRLTRASTPITINNERLNALVDTGSCNTFISDSMVNRLDLTRQNFKEKISMASSSLATETNGLCCTDIDLNNNHYKSVNLKVMKNLCCDVIFEQVF